MRLSIKSLEAVVASYVDASKISVESFSVTRDNIIGLLDKVGKIYTIDTTVYDKLPELDGEVLSFGKTVEEWQLDMTLPIDYDADTDGTKALANYAPSARPVSYSYTLGKKIFATSIPYNNIERAVHFEAQLVEIVSRITKKLEDSVASWKYGLKRELLGKAIAKAEAAISGATTYTQNSTVLAAGTYYKNGSGDVALCMKSETAAVNKSFATLVGDGQLIVIKMIHTCAVPVDDTTGEAFIQAVKEEVEHARDVNEGYSFNGNVIGVEEGLKLYVNQGILPSLEVNTLAGAFHEEKLAMDVEAKAIKDFGGYSGNAFAILMDSRAVRLFQDYNGTFQQENGFAARMNYFRHLEFTGHISRNAFIVVFVPAAE